MNASMPPLPLPCPDAAPLRPGVLAFATLTGSDDALRGAGAERAGAGAQAGRAQGGAAWDWQGAWQREQQRSLERDPQTGLGAQPGALPPESLPRPAAPFDAACATERTSPRPPHPDTPVPHVHAEWSDAGVRVWIGAPLGCLIAPAALLSPLRARLERQGARLLGLVCNGVPLMTAARPYADAPVHSMFAGEAPWPKP